MGLRITSASTKFVVAIVALAIVLLIGAGSTALAVPLPVGGSVVPGVGAPPGGAAHLAGTNQPFASQDAPVNPNGTSYTGTLQSDVWMGYPGNPFVGGLTFTFVMSNNGPDRLDRLTVSDYTGYGTDVAQDLTVGTAPAVLADRDVTGETVIWQFGNAPGLTAGTSSYRLIVHTNATQFTQALAGILNGAPASALTFGPTPLPEPATLAGVALLGLGIIARRR